MKAMGNPCKVPWNPWEMPWNPAGKRRVCYWTWPIEFVNWPNLRMLIFHSYVNVDQWVTHVKIKHDRNPMKMHKSMDRLQGNYTGKPESPIFNGKITLVSGVQIFPTKPIHWIFHAVSRGVSPRKLMKFARDLCDFYRSSSLLDWHDGILGASPNPLISVQSLEETNLYIYIYIKNI